MHRFEVLTNHCKMSQRNHMDVNSQRCTGVHIGPGDIGTTLEKGKVASD